jgi:glycosyltransferase involved in cell wall biosynthesis
MDNVITIKDNLTDPEWCELMHNADCLVYPSSGEGFGLMPLEFACTGGLAIATDYSGMQEYLHDVTMLPVQVKQIVPADLYNRIYNNEANWAEPNWDDVADKMKWVAENREQAWQMGRQAAEQVRQRWTWEQAGQVAKAALEALI